MSIKPTKPDGELAGLFIRVNNMFFQVATAGNDCDESVRDQAIPLYTEPQSPDLKSEKSSPPVSKFDNEYIRTRLDVFDDTHELAGWLLEEADRYHEAQLFADEYNLREAATSLCEMYADLKDFGNELIRLQERQKAVPVAPDVMTVEAAYPEVQTGWNDAKNYTSGWNACRAAMLQSFGNSEQLSPPVIQEGWMMVPKTLTTGMREAALAVFGIGDIDIEWSHLLAAAPKPETEKSMKEHKEYLAKEAALAKIISTAGKDPSEITDAVWAAGYRKPERTEEEAINLAIDTFTDSRYNGIPDDAWPKTYDEILQCELNEIIEEVTWSYFSPENIANRLIGEGYRKEEP